MFVAMEKVRRNQKENCKVMGKNLFREDCGDYNRYNWNQKMVESIF